MCSLTVSRDSRGREGERVSGRRKRRQTLCLSLSFIPLPLRIDPHAIDRQSMQDRLLCVSCSRLLTFLASRDDGSSCLACIRLGAVAGEGCVRRDSLSG